MAEFSISSVASNLRLMGMGSGKTGKCCAAARSPRSAASSNSAAGVRAARHSGHGQAPPCAARAQ